MKLIAIFTIFLILISIPVLVYNLLNITGIIILALILTLICWRDVYGKDNKD